MTTPLWNQSSEPVRFQELQVHYEKLREEIKNYYSSVIPNLFISDFILEYIAVILKGDYKCHQAYLALIGIGNWLNQTSEKCTP